MSEVPLKTVARLREAAHTTPELTRGNHKSQFHEFTEESTSKVYSHYLSRSQWLRTQLLVEESRVEMRNCSEGLQGEAEKEKWGGSSFSEPQTSDPGP